MFSSVRMGRVRFNLELLPNHVFGYDGQVETDIVVGKDHIVAIEAKSSRDLLKHKVAYSCQGIAELTSMRTAPAVAYVDVKELIADIILLEPVAERGRVYPVYAMEPLRVVRVCLVS